MSTAGPALEVRREARRQRLLDAALSLFVQQGFHAASVEDIVATARTSKSAFYEHFESKEDCCRQLLEEEGGALIAAVRTAAAAGGDHRERTRLGIGAFVRTCVRQGKAARLLLVESVGLSESIEAVRHRLHRQFAELVEAEVRHALGAGDPGLVGVDAALYGRVVVGAVNEATGWFLARGGDGADPAPLVEGLCRILAP
jgi:AcrR family transcriptional regulator